MTEAELLCKALDILEGQPLAKIATKVQPLTAREFGIDRRRIPFDMLISRPEHEGADVTLVDLDNFFSVSRRHALERVLAVVVEAQMAEDEAA